MRYAKEDRQEKHRVSGEMALLTPCCQLIQVVSTHCKHVHIDKVCGSCLSIARPGPAPAQWDRLAIEAEVTDHFQQK